MHFADLIRTSFSSSSKLNPNNNTEHVGSWSSLVIVTIESRMRRTILKMVTHPVDKPFLIYLIAPNPIRHQTLCWSSIDNIFAPLVLTLLCFFSPFFFGSCDNVKKYKTKILDCLRKANKVLLLLLEINLTRHKHTSKLSLTIGRTKNN